MFLDAKSGRVAPLLSGYNGERFKGLNDLVFASNGDLYFTDQGQTGLQDLLYRRFGGRLRADRGASHRRPGDVLAWVGHTGAAPRRRAGPREEDRLRERAVP